MLTIRLSSKSSSSAEGAAWRPAGSVAGSPQPFCNFIAYRRVQIYRLIFRRHFGGRLPSVWLPFNPGAVTDTQNDCRAEKISVQQQPPFLGTEIYHFVRLELVDLTDCHSEFAGLHITCGEIAADSSTF